jgi:O-succinylbenzoate synthase
MHVVDIPMRVRFRRQDRRSALLIHGDAGWGEFSPFPEYDDRVAARWLAAAREAADVGWPEPRRSEIPVNTTVPRCRRSRPTTWSRHPAAAPPR